MQVLVGLLELKGAPALLVLRGRVAAVRVMVELGHQYGGIQLIHWLYAAQR